MVTLKVTYNKILIFKDLFLIALTLGKFTLRRLVFQETLTENH